MNEHGVTDPNDKEAVRKHGGIDLATIQKKINFHYSVTLDLFGAEISTNAANSFNASLKGRYREPLIDDDHQLETDTYPVAQVVDGKVQILDTPALSAINARLCDDFIDDCEKVMLRWNRVFQTHNLDYSLKLPHRAFHRAVGERMDGIGQRSRIHPFPDAAGNETRQVRRLDRRTARRHQRAAG
jgi:benzoyl-CoA 2,3-dioxygenase component B